MAPGLDTSNHATGFPRTPVVHKDGSGSGKCGYDVYPPVSVPASPAFARPLACPQAEIPTRARARRESAGIGQPVTRKRRPPNPRWRTAGRRLVRRRRRPGRHPVEETTVERVQECEWRSASVLLAAGAGGGGGPSAKIRGSRRRGSVAP
jgi:hypothetical protein